jgi:hypothetical protein
MRYDYIKYPEDRLYLRVGNLLTSLKDYTIKEGNLQLYAYLLTISRSIKPDDIDGVIKTEKHILSKNFLYQRDFNDKDRDYMIPIIRDYKLNMLV